MSETCKPALKKDGTLPGKCQAMRLARRVLIERDGQPPGPKMLCRHLCENDSSMPNGFVCTVHTVWGTYSENKLDEPPETRSKGAKIANARPDNVNKVKVKCPHCGKVGNKLPMAQWHFDRCKFLVTKYSEEDKGERIDI